VKPGVVVTAAYRSALDTYRQGFADAIRRRDGSIDRTSRTFFDDAALPTSAKAALLWEMAQQYRDNPDAQHYLLDLLTARGPGEQIVSIINAFNSRSAGGEYRAYLARVIAAGYASPTPAGQFPSPEAEASNAMILDALRIGMGSSDPRVSTTSLQAFSRIGPASEVLTALDHALAEKRLVGVEYAREILIQLPTIDDSAVQSALVDKIVYRGEIQVPNLGAEELLRLSTALMSGSSAIAHLGPEARAKLQQFVVANEPAVEIRSGDLFVPSAVQYSTWLMLSASLANPRLGPAQQVLQVIGGGHASGAQILAVLTSANRDDILCSADAGARTNMISGLQELIRTNDPSSPMARGSAEMVQAIRNAPARPSGP
jgi:hypothetical protein